MNIENNKIAIICITQNGKNLALKLQSELKEGQVYFVKKKSEDELQESSKGIIRIYEKLKDFVPSALCVILVVPEATDVPLYNWILVSVEVE